MSCIREADGKQAKVRGFGCMGGTPLAVVLARNRATHGRSVPYCSAWAGLLGQKPRPGLSPVLTFSAYARLAHTQKCRAANALASVFGPVYASLLTDRVFDTAIIWGRQTT